jgi:hypothetical protein
MDTAMVGGQMSRLDEALGSYMAYSQQKKEKLAELGSESKIDRMTEAMTKVQEGVAGAGEGAMALSQFGTAILEKKGVAGLKNLIARHYGRGQPEAEAQAEQTEADEGGAEEPQAEQTEVAQAPVSEEVSGFRVPEGFTRMRGGAVGEAREMTGYGERPPSDAPARDTGEGLEGQAEQTEAYDPSFIPTYSAQDLADMGRESREMSRAALESSREKGLGTAEPEQSFRYEAPLDPAQAGRSMAERFAGAGEEGYGGLRGSSTLARATRQAPQVAEAEDMPQPVSLAEHFGMPEGTRFRISGMGEAQAGQTRQPVSTMSSRVGAADTEAGADIGRTEQLQDVAVRRIRELRGEEVGDTGGGGEAPLDETGGDVATGEEVGSLLDTIGGWSGALNVLGGVGMLAGIGGTIYGGIEAGKEESEQQSAIRQEQEILSKPTNVNFGSLALPTYDTTAMRGGGGMGHF